MVFARFTSTRAFAAEDAADLPSMPAETSCMDDHAGNGHTTVSIDDRQFHADGDNPATVCKLFAIRRQYR